MNDLFSLKGKTALVTGATHGLGMAMAIALGKTGANIVFNGHSSQDKINRALKRYEESGAKATGFFRG